MPHNSFQTALGLSYERNLGVPTRTLPSSLFVSIRPWRDASLLNPVCLLRVS